MIDIGLGVSQEKNTVLAAEEAVRRARKNRHTPGKPGLALLFCSSDFPYPPLLKSISSMLEGTPIMGLSGPAVITPEGIFTHGLQLMLIDFPSDIHCSTSFVKDLKTRPTHQAGEELGDKLMADFRNMPRNVGLALFDRVIEDGQGFISGLQEYVGTSFPCFGACAADPFSPTTHRMLYGPSAYTDGCCGMVLGGKITFGCGIQHGWKPIGKPRVITAASGSIVRTIDNQPAVRLYEEYLSRTTSALKREIEKISVFYPIGLRIEGEEEYLIRNVVSINDDGSLHCQGNVPAGASIRLMISTKETCLDATKAAIDEALATVASPLVRFYKEKMSRFAIVFSSFSRHTLLKREAAKELDLLKKQLGDIPFMGIYTASELAPMRASSYHGQVYFHNQTFSCLLVEG
jgi:hypothetical protein